MKIQNIVQGLALMAYFANPNSDLNAKAKFATAIKPDIKVLHKANQEKESKPNASIKKTAPSLNLFHPKPSPMLPKSIIPGTTEFYIKKTASKNA